MPKVFVSHSSLNKQFIKREIVDFLESQGIETWYSDHHLRPGTPWDRDIRQALDECDWFLLAMSPQAAVSAPVREELEHVLNRRPGVLIIPVLLHDCQPAAFGERIAALQYVDFRKDFAAARAKLLTCLVHHLNSRKNEAEEKARQLAQECERLHEENEELTEELQRATDQITSLARFDGKSWERPVEGPAPTFRPREQRRSRVIAVTNLKGGVGKTTLTANLAATLWGKKRRVLLVDLDYQGTLTSICLSPQEALDLRRQRHFVQNLFRDEGATADDFLSWAVRVRGTDGLLVGAEEGLAELEMQALARWLVKQTPRDVRFLLREALHSAQVGDAFDVVLLDCPPRLTTACINALAASDYVLIPTLLDVPSAEAVPRQLRWLIRLRPHLFPELAVLGVVGNRAFPRQKLIAREQAVWAELAAKCADAWGAPVHQFGTVLRDEGAFAEAAKKNSFAAAQSQVRPVFLDLVAEIEREILRHESREPAAAAGRP